MKKNKIMMIVHIVLAVLSFLAFNNPDLFASGGFALAIDGLVVARGMCFVFALYNVGKAFSAFFE